MILFKTIRWKNFLSTGNNFTEIKLNNSETTLIVGENGAGKSTLLDALSFVLFNKPFRKINKPLLMNSITKKDLVVEIEFSIGKKEYKIVRGIKPNVFEVYMNDSLLNQSAENKDYQEILEKQILKINHKSFCQVVILGSASFVPFMQLPAGQRREVIEDLLDLQIFTTMNGLLKDKISNNSGSIKDNESDIKLIDEKINLTKQYLIDLQNSNADVIAEKKQRIKDADTKIGFLENDIEALKAVIKDLESKSSNLDEVKDTLEKIKKLRYKFDNQIEALNHDLDFFGNHDTCPTCTQNIDNEFKDKTIKEKANLRKEIEDNLSVVIDKFEENNKKLSDMMDIVSSITDNKMKLNGAVSEISSLNSYKKELKDDVKKLNKESKPEDNTKIDSLVEEKKTLEKNLNDLLEDKETMHALSILLKDSGIKAKIIKQYIPIINKLINKYLSAMDFFVQFELNEQFDETIKSRYRDTFSYSSFSEGEKMRINLAILFTWRAVAKLRNSINTNILIMDEVFDSSLDSNGTEEFMKILNNLTKDTNTFIISHKTDQLYDKFKNVIKFKKHKNFSSIES